MEHESLCLSLSLSLFLLVYLSHSWSLSVLLFLSLVLCLSTSLCITVSIISLCLSFCLSLSVSLSLTGWVCLKTHRPFGRRAHRGRVVCLLYGCADVNGIIQIVSRVHCSPPGHCQNPTQTSFSARQTSARLIQTQFPTQTCMSDYAGVSDFALKCCVYCLIAYNSIQ